MKALLLEQYNTPFKLAEVAKPVPGKGEVLVKIAASGVNPLDLKIKAGAAGHAQTKLPAILGIDLAGTVEALGEGVTGFKPGDAVYGMTGGIAGIPGSLAEYAAVDARLIAHKPSNISFKEAAALPLIFITAWEGLVDKAHVKENDTVLVQGGAGGVGHIAVQLAKAYGAQVFATASAGDADYITQLGATPIDYRVYDADRCVREYSDGKGFDIVYDTVGGSSIDESFLAAKRYTGHVLTILGWGTHSLAPLSFRSGTYSGVFTLYPLISGEYREHHGAILKEATKLIEAGKIKPLVDPADYSPETIAEAYSAIENRTNRGKVVVTIS